MRIAVLCFDCGEVDIIDNVPQMDTNEEVEEYLTSVLDYNADEISWMTDHGKGMQINYLTPNDFE